MYLNILSKFPSYRDSSAFSLVEAGASASPRDTVCAVIIEAGAGVVEQAGSTDLNEDVKRDHHI